MQMLSLICSVLEPASQAVGKSEKNTVLPSNYGHDHSSFRSAMATNGFGQRPWHFLHYVLVQFPLHTNLNSCSSCINYETR